MVAVHWSCVGIAMTLYPTVVGNNVKEPIQRHFLATHTAAKARTMHINIFLYYSCLFVVDGEWTDWYPHECSVTCGGGIRNLTRTCTNPAPSCNGTECIGVNAITEKCNMHCCPGAI